MYRIYLRQHDQTVLRESKINTASPLVAAEAFAALVNRVDLDGQRIAAVLSENSRQMAFHRFDRPAGDMAHWRGRLHEIEWPTAAHGGERANAGRKAGTSDGGELRPYTVKLDKTSWEILTALGDGQLSEGIRRAARAAAPKD